MDECWQTQVFKGREGAIPRAGPHTSPRAGHAAWILQASMFLGLAAKACFSLGGSLVRLLLATRQCHQ